MRQRGGAVAADPVADQLPFHGDRLQVVRITRHDEHIVVDRAQQRGLRLLVAHRNHLATGHVAENPPEQDEPYSSEGTAVAPGFQLRILDHCLQLGHIGCAPLDVRLILQDRLVVDQRECVHARLLRRCVENLSNLIIIS